MGKLSAVKAMSSDKEKVLKWLDSIGEKDRQCIDEVIEQCAKDQEARDYYVGRYSQECAI